MNLGVAGAALPLLFSTFTQAPLQTTRQLVMRSYTPTYLKIINNYLTMTKRLPKLPSEAYSTIKRLGISRHWRGTRHGFQVKHRHLENLHTPTRISCERLSKADKRGINLLNLCPLKRIHESKQDKSPYPPASEVELLHLNIRSLKDRTHLLELRELASERKSSIITISETWLNTSVTSAEIQINGYKPHRLDWLHKRGQGVCAYIHRDLKSSVIKDLSSIFDQNFHQLWLNVQYKKLK